VPGGASADVELTRTAAQQFQVFLGRHTGLVQVRGHLVQRERQIAQPLRESRGMVLGEGRCPATQERGGVATVEGAQVHHSTDGAKSVPPGGDKYFARTIGQQPADVIGFFRVVEDQQPTPHATQMALDRAQGRIGIIKSRHAQLYC
jgi:hypothetical protein